MTYNNIYAILLSNKTIKMNNTIADPEVLSGVSPTDFIRITVYVRDKENAEGVSQFVNMINSGNEDKIPAIDITDDGRVIDGRTRHAAYTICEKPIKWVKKGMPSDEELLIMALAANLGGSKPPTEQDIRMTVKQLVRAGMKQGQIVESLEQKLLWGKKMMIAFVKKCQSDINWEKVIQAKRAVLESTMTPIEAAKHYGCDLATLQKELGGVQKIQSPSEALGKEKAKVKLAFNRMKNNTVYFGASAVAKLLDDGYITEKEVKEFSDALLKELESLKKKITRETDRLTKRK